MGTVAGDKGGSGSPSWGPWCLRREAGWGLTRSAPPHPGARCRWLVREQPRHPGPSDPGAPFPPRLF